MTANQLDAQMDVQQNVLVDNDEVVRHVSKSAASPMRTPLADVKNKKMNGTSSNLKKSVSKPIFQPKTKQQTLISTTSNEFSSPASTTNQSNLLVNEDGGKLAVLSKDTTNGKHSEGESPTGSVLQRRRLDAAMKEEMINFESRCLELQRELEEAKRAASESNSESHALMEMNTMLTWRLAEMEITLSEQRNSAMTSPSCSRKGAHEEDAINSSSVQKDGVHSLHECDELESCDSKSCEAWTEDGSPGQIVDFFTRYDANSGTPQNVNLMHSHPGLVKDDEVDAVAALTSRMLIAEAKAELLSERLQTYTSKNEDTVTSKEDSQIESTSNLGDNERTAIERENESLLAELKKKATSENVIESYKVEVQTKTEMIEKLEMELAHSRAENYELACKHKAGLSRLQNVIEGDGKLRRQLAAQAAFISRLESQRKQIDLDGVDIERQYHVKYQDLMDSNGDVRASISSQIEELTRENLELRESVLHQQESIEVLSSRGKDIMYLLEAVQSENESRARIETIPPNDTITDDSTQVRTIEIESDSEFITLKSSYQTKWKAAEEERRAHVNRISELETQINELQNHVRQSRAENDDNKRYVSELNHDRIEFERVVRTLLSTCLKRQNHHFLSPTHLMNENLSDRVWGSRPLSWKLSIVMGAKSRIDEILECCREFNENSIRQQDTILKQKQKLTAIEQDLENSRQREQQSKLEVENRAQSEIVVRNELQKAAKALSVLDEDTRKLRHKLSTLTSAKDADAVKLKALESKAFALEKEKSSLIKELDDALERERIAIRKAEQYLTSSKSGEELFQKFKSLPMEVAAKSKKLEVANKELEDLRIARLKDEEASLSSSKRIDHLEEVSRCQVQEIGSLKSDTRRLKKELEFATIDVQKQKDRHEMERNELEKKVLDAKTSMHEMERDRKSSDEALKLSTSRIETLNECIRANKEELTKADESKNITMRKLASLQHELDSACEMIGEMEKTRNNDRKTTAMLSEKLKAMSKRSEMKFSQIESLQKELLISDSARKEAEYKMASLQSRCDSMDIIEATIRALKQSSSGSETSESVGTRESGRMHALELVTMKDDLFSLLSNNTSLVKEISERLTKNLLEKPLSVHHLETKALENSSPRLSNNSLVTQITCPDIDAVHAKREESDGSECSTRAHASSMRKLLIKARYYRDRCKLLEQKLEIGNCGSLPKKPLDKEDILRSELG